MNQQFECTDAERGLTYEDLLSAGRVEGRVESRVVGKVESRVVGKVESRVVGKVESRVVGELNGLRLAVVEVARAGGAKLSQSALSRIAGAGANALTLTSWIRELSATTGPNSLFED
ncbi:MAG: hypothetical protein ACJAYU_001861 [Bradymonadia bacterium]|jgi:hypothetical protein